jgi:hypothetical protein
MKKILMILMTLGLFVSCSMVSKKPIKTKDYLIEAVGNKYGAQDFLKKAFGDIETDYGIEVRSIIEKELSKFIETEIVGNFEKFGLKEELPSLEKLEKLVTEDEALHQDITLTITVKVLSLTLYLYNKFPIEENEKKKEDILQ